MLAPSGTTTCLPTITSITTEPSNLYYAGDPYIQNSTTQTFTLLTSFEATKSGSCIETYQLSNDGVNFYYHNGANWVTATMASQSNNEATVQANIGTFHLDVGPGVLFWRAFMNSDSSNDCVMDNLEIGLFQ